MRCRQLGALLVRAVTMAGLFEGGGACAVQLPARYRAMGCDGLAAGQTCFVACESGWSLVGSPQLIECLDSGNFSAELPVCEPSGCSPPAEAVDVDLAGCAALTTGETCAAVCAAGYEGDAATLTCLATGYVDGTLPSCAARTCPTPVLPGVAHTCNGVSLGSSCSMFCSGGYQSATNSALQWECVWDADRQDVAFQGPAPQCVPMQCQNNLPQGPAYAHNCTGIRTDESCVWGCAQGYQGTAVHPTCLANGWLSTAAPACVPEACPGLQGPSFSGTCSSSTPIGERCYVLCARGFSGAPALMTCALGAAGSGLLLQGNLPACTPDLCISGRPFGIQYDVEDCRSAATHESCTVQCAPGWEGVSQIFTCADSGHLQGTVPACTIITTSTTQTATTHTTETTLTGTATTATSTATLTRTMTTTTSVTSTMTTSTATATSTTETSTTTLTETATATSTTETSTTTLTETATSGTDTTQTTTTGTGTTTLTGTTLTGTATSGTSATATSGTSATATSNTNTSTTTGTTVSTTQTNTTSTTATTLTMTTTTATNTTISSTVTETSSTQAAAVVTTVRGDMTVAVSNVSNLTQLLASPAAAAAVRGVVATLGQVLYGYTGVTMAVAAQGSALVDYTIEIPANAPPSIDTTGARVAAAIEAVAPGQMAQLLSAALGAALDDTAQVLNVTMGPVEILDMLSTTTSIGTPGTASTTGVAASVYVPIIIVGALLILALLGYLLYACRRRRARAAKANEASNAIDDSTERGTAKRNVFEEIVEI